VACVWRRQTFSAAVDRCAPDMSLSILQEQLPSLMHVIAPSGELPPATVTILDSAYEFSRMLHGSDTSSTDAFYRAFVPELGSALYPRQIELVKRCMKSERRDTDRGMIDIVSFNACSSLSLLAVGASIFPGLVKVTRGPMTPGGGNTENVQVRSIYSHFSRIDIVL
jgi:hypothetical protein